KNQGAGSALTAPESSITYRMLPTTAATITARSVALTASEGEEGRDQHPEGEADAQKRDARLTGLVGGALHLARRRRLGARLFARRRAVVHRHARASHGILLVGAEQVGRGPFTPWVAQPGGRELGQVLFVVVEEWAMRFGTAGAHDHHHPEHHRRHSAAHG